MIGLEYIRGLFDLSMQDLADKLGVTANTINLWEKLKMPISEKRANQLKELFHLPEIVFQKELTEEDKVKVQQVKLAYAKMEIENDISIKDRYIVEIEKEVLPKNAIIIDEKYKKLYGKFEMLLGNSDPKVLEDLLDNLIKMSGSSEK